MVKDARKKHEESIAGELIDYEEVKTERLELPPLEKPKEKKKGDYDQMFDE